MAEIWADVVEWVTGPESSAILRGALILVLGIVFGRLLSVGLARLAMRRGYRQGALVARRLTFYFVGGVASILALHEWGVEIGVLLGAAGILTVAIGFASQTSASNLISGLFLLGERPFIVGDVINVEGTIGEVLSIDLLSVKLRTFNNTLVRIPNESLLKVQLVNLSYFPIRRLDVTLNVAYDTDLKRVRRTLIDLADHNPLVLDEPRPRIQFTGFGDSALTLEFSVWVARSSIVEVRSRLYEEVKVAFDAAGILIPLPQRVIHTMDKAPAAVPVPPDAPPPPSPEPK